MKTKLLSSKIGKSICKQSNFKQNKTCTGAKGAVGVDKTGTH